MKFTVLFPSLQITCFIDFYIRLLFFSYPSVFVQLFSKLQIRVLWQVLHILLVLMNHAMSLWKFLSGFLQLEARSIDTRMLMPCQKNYFKRRTGPTLNKLEHKQAISYVHVFVHFSQITHCQFAFNYLGVYTKPHGKYNMYY